MKLVREHIEFERGLEPKKAMKLGIYTKRNFNSREELADFILNFLPAILQLPEIPEDILGRAGTNKIINYPYFLKIKNFIDSTEKTVNNRIGDRYPTLLLAQKLKKMGFKE